MMELSAQELQLLRLLQRNSRFDITELTEQLGMSRTSVYERIRKLENEGYIKNYVALVDPRKVGLTFTVIVTVSLNTQRIDYVDEFLERISALDEIMEAFVTGGVFDVVLKVVVANPDAFNNFITSKLSTIPHISRIRSSFVMRNIKDSTILPF